MIKLLLAGAVSFICFGANAAYTFPDNAETKTKPGMTVLDSLSYTVEADDVSKDDIKLCLADTIDNDSDEIIKAETDTAMIAMGKIRIDKNGWGNDHLIRYDVKLSIEPNTIDLKFYKIGFAYAKDGALDDKVKYREPSTIFGGGGDITVKSINELAEQFSACLGI